MPEWLLPLLGTNLAAATGGVLAARLFRRRPSVPTLDEAERSRVLDESLQSALAREQALAVELAEARREADRLRGAAEKYDKVRARLAKSLVTRNFNQPVLVVGPRFVGKTSLVEQWHAPWDLADVEGTVTHRVRQVPILTHDATERAVHFADPELQVRTRTCLGLRLHDFPGELLAQQKVIEVVRDEARRLERQSGKRLGVTILCLFSAEEAALGIRPETNSYYNGEMFRSLRLLVSQGDVGLERLFLVYNKADLLRREVPELAPAELLTWCSQCFATTCSPLRAIVSPERVREVLTVLARGQGGYQSEGAVSLKGEVARPLVHTFVNPIIVDMPLTPDEYEPDTLDV